MRPIRKFLQLVRAKDEFVILRESTDKDIYKVKLLSCFLYVPVAQLSSGTFSEIERVLSTKSTAIHYRKIEIRNVSLIKGKEEYNSDNLFLSDCPCRIVICFIESKNKTGSFDLNPFDFKRSWKVTVNSSLESSQVSERERYLEKRLLDFEKQLAYFKSCVTLVQVNETDSSSKGKGRGKKSNNTPAADGSSSIFERLRSSFSGPNENETDSVRSEPRQSSSRSNVSTPPPPYGTIDDTGATTKTIYIKQVQLLLNGAPLDQVESRETGFKICLG